MTYEDFFKALKRTRKKRAWRLVNNEDIRCKDDLCPIIAVFYDKGGPKKKNKDNYDEPYGNLNNAEWDVAAEFIGLTEDQAEGILNAADWTNDDDDQTPSQKRLRRRLLEAVGLA